MATTTTTAIRIIRSRNTKLARWLRRRRERKQALKKLRRIVPFVDSGTPLLELLQKVIDYITELQELLNEPTMDMIENKENMPSLRSNELNFKIQTRNCINRSSKL